MTTDPTDTGRNMSGLPDHGCYPHITKSPAGARECSKCGAKADNETLLICAATTNVEHIPEYFEKEGIAEGLAEVHPVLLVRQMANEILRQQRELADCRAELERGYQHLESCGVSRERAKSIGNGIVVLSARYEKEVRALREASRLAAHAEREGAEPVSMLLFCPRCSKQHVDAPDGDWTNPPHATHTCKFCGLLWRPSNTNTEGVERIEAKEAQHTQRIANSTPHPAPSAASGLAGRLERWADAVAQTVSGGLSADLIEAATFIRSHQAPVGEGQNALLREIRDNLKWSSIPYEQELHARIDRALKTPSPQTGGGS